MNIRMGLIYVDANVFITAFEAEATVASPARNLFKVARGRPYRLVTSELTIAEVLAPASAPGSLPLAKKLEIYQTVLLWSDFIQIIPVNRTILVDTASLRAVHRQKLPDAMHAATALQTDCRYFCSSDRDSRRLPSALTSIRPDGAGVSTLLDALRS